MPSMDDETCIYIPFEGTDDDFDDAQDDSYASPELLRESTSPEGARIAAYKQAWGICLRRIQTVVDRIQEASVRTVLEEMRTAYNNPLPGLPYPELPTLVLGDDALLTAVLHHLSSSEHTTHCIQLHSAECNNIMNTMKALVGGFISLTDSDPGTSRRRPATALANYDVNLLHAWYKAQRHIYDEAGTTPGPLVIVVHSFEQFNPDVLRALWHICSRQAPALPFVFLLSTQSPIPRDFLQSTYPRSVLALLRFRHIAPPIGLQVLEDVVSQVFFDLDIDRTPSSTADTHELVIMIGPAALDFLVEFCTRYHVSVDIIITILQLAHMKHFEVSPLAAFALGRLPRVSALGHSQDDMMESEYREENVKHSSTHEHESNTAMLQSPEWFDTLHALLIRTHAATSQSLSLSTSPPVSTSWSNTTIPSLMDALSSAHRNFRTKSHGVREAYGCVWVVSAWMRAQGYKVLSADDAESARRRGREAYPRLMMMRKVLDSTIARDVKYLGMMIGKLDKAKLTDFAGVLRGHIRSVTSPNSELHVEDSGEDQGSTIAALLQQLLEVEDELSNILVNAELVDPASPVKATAATASSTGGGGRLGRNPRVAELAEVVRALFLSYVNARLIPLDSNAVPLWDIWYMGTTPFPAELLNPAPRASIYGALLSPHAYVKAAIPVPISIVVTDSTSVPSTPRKNKGNGRAESKSPVKTNARSHMNAAADGQIKLKLHNLPDTSILFRRYLNAGRMINVYDWFESFKLAVDPQRPENVDEDDEMWNTELHARFMRSLHELDWLGFIKHTKRKMDHVAKTVFELPE